MNNSIVPCLWFDDNAEDAVNFYASLFENSKILSTRRYGKEGFEIHQRPDGSVMTMNFELSGQKFLALNGGPIFKFSEAVSLFVYCESNERIETLYKQLSDGGSVLMPLGKYDWSEKYAWVKDKFGLSWQLDIDKINSPQKILPSFLFTNEKSARVKEAADCFTNIFPNSKTIMEMPVEPSGEVLLFAQFSLNGYLFNAMTGGEEKHQFDFNEAISFIVNCETQEEIDNYWARLSAGGEEGPCGWLKDKFGISWQIVPTILDKLLSDPSKASKATAAFLKMQKFDIAALIEAAQS